MNNIPDIVDLVLGLLALLSVIVWAIAIAKFVMFYRTNARDAVFLQKFNRAKDVFKLTELIKDTDGGLVRICRAGLKELQQLHLSGDEFASSDKRELFLHVLKQQAYKEQHRAEKGLALLASIGSTAPFIGLLGTVWGIMHALEGISASGSAGLDVVAGPIGEALIATAVGIATAIPAVLAYNYFLRKLKVSQAKIENFGANFQYLVIKSGLAGA